VGGKAPMFIYQAHLSVYSLKKLRLHHCLPTSLKIYKPIRLFTYSYILCIIKLHKSRYAHLMYLRLRPILTLHLTYFYSINNIIPLKKIKQQKYEVGNRSAV